VVVVSRGGDPDRHGKEGTPTGTPQCGVGATMLASLSSLDRRCQIPLAVERAPEGGGVLIADVVADRFNLNPQLDAVKCAFSAVQGKAQRRGIVVLVKRL